jgi:glycosyltransferase involved in cell wall biosynthesis
MRALYHHRTQGRDVEAVHIHGVCGGLRQLGFEVEILSPPGVDTDPNSTHSPVTRQEPTLLGRLARSLPQVLFEALEIGYNLVAVPRLWVRCLGSRPVLIYERYSLYNAAAVVVSGLTGIPAVLEVNETAGVDRTRQGKQLALPGLARWFERRIFRAASGLPVVSGYLREYAIAAGAAPERVRVTPTAVDAERFDPARVDARAVRARLGLEGSTVVGFAGSFAKWHGVNLLLEAAAKLAGELPDLRLLLVGDGAGRCAAEARAAELGLADRVVFTGKVPHAEIPAYMAAMDVGVMPASNVYGSPMKVFEYMAMGCPPVAPLLPPLEEVIVDGQIGILFQPGDAADLARGLRCLVADPQRRMALGEAARREVLSRRLWVHNAEAVLELAAPSERGPRLAAAGWRQGS